MTPPEAALWLRLRKRLPDRPNFRRQHATGPCILDFYCVPIKLAVEIDGFVHLMGSNPEHDIRRTAWLNAQGIEVYRIPALDVLRDTDEVADRIWLLARTRARGE